MRKNDLLVQRANISKEARYYFRDQFRVAISIAQRDSEGFQEILLTLERLGITLSGKIDSLGGYKASISRLVQQGSARESVVKELPQWHLPFSELYDIVKDARNEAVHSGAVARHITRNAIRLALILKGALMADATYVREFMVRELTCAYLWQPVSLARQQMLANNFTYLPIRDTTTQPSNWMLLADFQIAKYLRRAVTKQDLKILLAKSIEAAVSSNELQLIEPHTCRQNQLIQEIQEQVTHIPFLVLDETNPEILVGILTPFDLL